MKYSIILPARNEEMVVAELVGKITTLYPDAEVILVDDASNDRTAKYATDAGAMVVSHCYQKGNGAGIKTGARVANGDVLIFMDADGQHDPAHISKLLDAIDSGADMVVGARDGESQASVARGVANRIYNFLASYVTEQKVLDLTSGFRAVNAAKFKEILYLLPNGFSYPTTSTMAFFRAGYTVLYIPIKVGGRVGKSHIKPWRDGIRFLLIIFKIATLYSPLKLFIPVSLLMFFLASAWYAHTLVEFGRFTNMSALLYTGSVIVFMMGLISEQITALLYKERD